MCNEKDCHIRYWSAVIACLIVGLSIGTNFGCEEFLTQADKVVQDVNNIATGTNTVLESPVGLMIPPEWKLYGALGVALANGLVITWQEWRNRTMKKTTRAIVQGIEKADNPQKANEVKANIALEMRRQGGDRFYAKANKIVDKLKISS